MGLFNRLNKANREQRKLADTAMNHSERAERKRAFKAITDPAAFAHIAHKAAGDGLRLSAVQQIEDQQVLRELAIDATDEEVQRQAVRQMHDEDLLAEVAEHTDDDQVRNQAKWGAAGLVGWAVIMPGTGYGQEERERMLQMATGTSCLLCGDSPCGEDAAAVLRDNEGENAMFMRGVCEDCVDGESMLTLGLRCKEADDS